MKYRFVKFDAELMLILTELLSDSETGRLFTAILTFMQTGEEPTCIKGNEKYVWSTVKQLIQKGGVRFRGGEEHWNWKGGKTSDNQQTRNSTEYAEWRNAVFKRDDYICQKCGQKGGALQAHHIMPFAYYPELRFSLDNGITLCKACHKEIHAKGIKNNGT